MDTTRKIHALLTQKKLTLTTAESFTGGQVSAKITSVAGASNFFSEGIVCYSALSKQKRLDVDKQTIQKYGAVSLPVARQMLLGALKNSDVGVATTGNAGPLTDSGDSGVGVCYIGAGIKISGAKSAAGSGVKYKIIIQRHVFSGDRAGVIKQGTAAALTLLHKILTSK